MAPCLGVLVPYALLACTAPSNRIMAQPATITGSIGVIAMKLNAREALQEYGITSDAVTLGDNATWASSFHELTPKQRQHVRTL